MGYLFLCELALAHAGVRGALDLDRSHSTDLVQHACLPESNGKGRLRLWHTLWPKLWNVRASGRKRRECQVHFLINSAVATFTTSGWDALRKCWPSLTTRNSASSELTNILISSSALGTE